jgi:hypothetical protein
MATYTWVGITSNWSTPTNWSGGAPLTIPGAVDDVIINNAAPCTVTADSLCFNINFTGYTSTFTITSGFTLSIRGTTITMSSSGMTFTTGTTGVLSTSSGASTVVNINFGTTVIPRLSLGKNNASPVLQTINISGTSPTVQNLTASSGAGVQVNLAGTGLTVTTSLSVLGTNILTGMQLTINGTCTVNTASNLNTGFTVTPTSTVILASTLKVGGGTITFQVGSFLTDVSFGVSINLSTSVLNTAPVTWYSFTQTVNGTTFITSDLNIGVGGISVGALGSFTFNGAFNVNVSGNVIAPTIQLSLNATLNLTGVGKTITVTGFQNGIVNIATGASYAIAGTVLTINNCTFRLVGTATCSLPVTHTLVLLSSTLTTNNTATGGSEIQWKNVDIVFTNTITHTTTVLGNLSGANASVSAINTGKMLVHGNLSIVAGGIFSGTSTIEFTGNVAATWGAGSYQNSINVSKSGGVVVTTGNAITWGFANRTLALNTSTNFITNFNTFTLSGTPLTITNSSNSSFYNITILNAVTLNIN